MSAVAVSTGPLAQLSRAVLMLAEAKTLDEVMHIKSVAEALLHYARAGKLGCEAVGYAMEIKIRAAERAGAMLASIEKAKGAAEPGTDRGRRNTNLESRQVPTLAEIGITPKQSSEFQRLAKLKKEKPKEFVQLLEAAHTGNSRELAKLKKSLPKISGRKPRIPSSARRSALLRLCDDIAEFGDPKAIAKEMASLDDEGIWRRRVLSANCWLIEFLKEWKQA